jgi:hypothetical protein
MAFETVGNVNQLKRHVHSSRDSGTKTDGRTEEWGGLQFSADNV